MFLASSLLASCSTDGSAVVLVPGRGLDPKLGLLKRFLGLLSALASVDGLLVVLVLLPLDPRPRYLLRPKPVASVVVVVVVVGAGVVVVVVVVVVVAGVVASVVERSVVGLSVVASCSVVSVASDANGS